MAAKRNQDPAIRAALERSLRSARADGRIDMAAQAALIAAARKLANLMDDPDWPLIAGRFDNVTPAKFLDYCTRLGLAPDAAVKTGGGAAPADELAAFKARHRSA